MENVGITAIIRVTRTRCQRAHLRFKNPSIANWPEYVPVIVELWPAAKIPIAHMYLKFGLSSRRHNFDYLSNSHCSNAKTASKEDSTFVDVGINSWASEYRLSFVTQERPIWTRVHDLLVGLTVKSVSEYADNKDVDDEGNKESDAGFDKEVIVSFLDFRWAFSVHISRFHQS
jgi:hypothetical protein